MHNLIPISETSKFELIQRKAKAYQISSVVPDTFKGNIGNCIIALEMAERMRMNPFMIMQNLYIIHGKPSFSSSFIIACINACGRFTPLRFKFSGVKGQPDRKCIAYCNDEKTGELLESIEISLSMANAEGWSTKKGSKWVTMPDLMLQYRAAAFFGRAYAPEALMGLYSVDEQHDINVHQSMDSKDVLKDILSTDNTLIKKEKDTIVNKVGYPKAKHVLVDNMLDEEDEISDHFLHEETPAENKNCG